MWSTCGLRCAEAHGMLCIETLVLPNTYLYTPCASCVLRMRQVARPVGQASRYARLPILAFLVQNAAYSFMQASCRPRGSPRSRCWWMPRKAQQNVRGWCRVRNARSVLQVLRVLDRNGDTSCTRTRVSVSALTCLRRRGHLPRYLQALHCKCAAAKPTGCAPAQTRTQPRWNAPPRVPPTCSRLSSAAKPCCKRSTAQGCALPGSLCTCGRSTSPSARAALEVAAVPCPDKVCAVGAAPGGKK